MIVSSRLVQPVMVLTYVPRPRDASPPASNMRELGVQRLIAPCLNDACRHTALIDVSSYPAETEVRGLRVRPNAASVVANMSTSGQTGKNSRRRKA